MLRAAIIAALLIAAAATLVAVRDGSDIEGLVGGTVFGESATVIDGTNFELTDRDGETYTIRLFGIDGPETNESPWSARARIALEQIVAGTSIIACRVVDTDRRDRLVAQCARATNMGPRPTPFAELLLEQGLARQDRRLQRDGFSDRYAAAEAQAREARRGMWQVADEPN